MIDTTLDPKPEYDYDLFLLKPEIGDSVSDKEYVQKVRDTIKSGDKIAISVWSQKQGNIFGNQCGFFGCRVLYPEIGTFRHGGSDKDKVPYTTIKLVSLDKPIEYKENIYLEQMLILEWLNLYIEIVLRVGIVAL